MNQLDWTRKGNAQDKLVLLKERLPVRFSQLTSELCLERLDHLLDRHSLNLGVETHQLLWSFCHYISKLLAH